MERRRRQPNTNPRCSLLHFGHKVLAPAAKDCTILDKNTLIPNRI